MKSSPSIRKWHFESRKYNWPDTRPRCRFIQAEKVTDFPTGIRRPNILILSNDQLAALDPTLEDDEKAALMVVLANKFERKSEDTSVLKEFAKALSVNAKAVGVFLVEGIDEDVQTAFATDICDKLGNTSRLLEQISVLVELYSANAFFYYDPEVFEEESSVTYRGMTGKEGHTRTIGRHNRSGQAGIFGISRGAGDSDDHLGELSLDGDDVAPSMNLDLLDGGKSVDGEPSGKIRRDIPRFLQAKVTEPGTQDPPLNFLIAYCHYTALVRIGAEESGWQDGDVPVNPADIAALPGEEKARIKIKFHTLLGDDIPIEEIEISPGQDSSIASFAFETGEPGIPFQASIFAYHGNRQIQQILLNAPVLAERESGTPTDRIKVRVVTSLRTNLDRIEERPAFGSSIHIDDDSIIVVKDGVSKTMPLSDEWEKPLSEIQALIQKNVLSEYPEDLFAPPNTELLHSLASWGSLAYDACLRRIGIPDGPIQIMGMSSKIVPIDWIYTLPPPDREAGLCPKAAEALQAGTCQSCFDKKEEIAPCICPFGFLCLSHVIERHYQLNAVNEPVGSYTVAAEPNPGNAVLNVFQQTLYASSKRVDGKLEGIRKRIKTALEKSSLRLDEAVDWKNWTQLVADKGPDSLVLLVHIERDPKSKIDRIEIENEQFLPLNLLVGSKVRSETSKAPPIVIALGCESTDIDKAGFDLSSRFLQKGAALVVSSFTQVRGSTLGSVVPKMVELIKAQSGKEARFGEIMLQLRQQLLAQGVMVVLSLVAHGDADWKIKS